MRTKCFKMRLTEAEHAAIHAKAQAAGCTVADFVRAIVLGIDQTRVLPAAREIVGLSSEVRRIGVNLNQIARHLNTTAKAGPLAARDFAGLADALTDALQAVGEARRLIDRYARRRRRRNDREVKPN